MQREAGLFSAVLFSRHTVFVFVFLTSITSAQFKNNLQINFKGAGWIKSGKIVQSTDTITRGINYNGNWLQDAGALFNGFVTFNPHFSAGFGLGAIQNHKAQGQPSLVDVNFKVGLNNFLTQSWVAYKLGDRDKPFLTITAGLFPYKYDNNIKNLGLYLVRGPVYPGVLISGFEAKEMLQTGNTLGLHFRNHLGDSFFHDLILKSEQNIAPLFDYSLLYIATYKPTPFLEIGAGVNFYRFLPTRRGATIPSKDDYDPEGPENVTNTTYQIEVDSATTLSIPDYYTFALPDTQFDPATRQPLLDTSNNPVVDWNWIPHQGIKLMGRFVISPGPYLPSAFGKNDLKLYCEAAVIGLKNYPGAYDKLSERIPIMFGLYLPTFAGFFEKAIGTTILDQLALEIEWYGAKYLPDYYELLEKGRTIPSSNYMNRSKIEDVYDGDGDNWKWSLYFAKIFAGHVKISGQAARDHLRTGGTTPTPAQNEVLTAKKDWYWMLKLSYFF